MDRRQFFARLSTAVLAAHSAATLLGCGDDGGMGMPDANNGMPDAGDGMPDAELPDGTPADAESGDAGDPDAASPDAGDMDAASPDAGDVDASLPDGGAPDAAFPDGGGVIDASPDDASVVDGGGFDGGGFDGGGFDAGSPFCSVNGPMGMVSNNHGHIVDIPAMDVQLGMTQAYSIQGASGHPHTIVVTAAQFAQLQQGLPVSVTSSLDAGHMHTVTLQCSGITPDAGVPPDAGMMSFCQVNGPNVTIGNNHGHVLAVPAAHVQAGVTQTYNIQGTSAHPHTVVVTASHFAMLAQGNQVTVVSTLVNGHMHTVLLLCLS